MAAPPRVGWVRLRSTDPPLVVVARLSGERPNVEGFGGWEEVARPRRKPLTTWRGSPALHLTLGLLLDGYAADRSVEAEITRLLRMASPNSSAGEPPVVRVQAAGSAIPYQNKPWVVGELSFGDALMNSRGNRTRQEVSLTLLEHVVDVYLSEKAAAHRRRANAARAKTKQGAAEKRIVAKHAAKQKKKHAKSRAVADDEEFGAGESLAAIAARELGDADRWPEIAALNGLRDPSAVTPGQVIRLP